MNAWEIMKAEYVKGERPGSFGWLVSINDAARLFVKLEVEGCFGEEAGKSAKAAFNADADIVQAIAAGLQHAELKKAGVV